MIFPNIADSELEDNEIESLLYGFITVKFPSGHSIVKSGENSTQAIYLQLNCQIQITDEKKGIVIVLTKGASCGGVILEPTDPPEQFVFDVTVEVIEDTEFYKLDQKAIKKVLGYLERLGKPIPSCPCKL